MDNLQPGQMLGPYRIISQIGQGGMATVYKAYHAAMDRDVAVKVLPQQLAETPAFMGRFQQEAHTIAHLEHTHILPVYDYGESGGITYLVMRYLDAGTLKDRLKTRPVPLAEIDRLFTQLASALSYAHSKGVIHRDLKPANALLDAQGSLFLSDFGIAKLLESDRQFTQTGGLIGTPDYMSPEQARGQPVDQHTDIYSLGIILYEMVTGRVPFEADTPLAVILKQINDPLPLPSSVKPDISPAVERVLLKALAKDPADRFDSAGAFVAAWKQALGEAKGRAQPALAELAPTLSSTTLPTPAKPRRPGPSAPASAARRNMWLAGGLVGVLALFGCLVLGAWAFSSLWSRMTTPVGATAAALRTTDTPIPSRPTSELPVTAGQPVIPSAPTAATPGQPPILSAGSWQAIVDLPRRINTLVVDPANPQVWYAGTGVYGSGGGGVYKSEDGGLTWRLMVKGLPDDVVKALAFSRETPPRLYAQVGPDGDLYVSADGAESWTRLGADPELCCNFDRELFASPQEGKTLFIVEYGGSVSYSRDGGQSWMRVKDERGDLEARSLAFDSTDSQVVYLGTEGHGVYKSVDGGATWVAANRGMLDYHITALAVNPAQSQTLYAGTDEGKLFKSVDGGQGWNDISATPPLDQIGRSRIVELMLDPAAPERVYVLVYSVGLLVSYDGGEQWQMLGKPGETDYPRFTVMMINFGPQPVIVVGTEDAGTSRYVP